MPKSVPRHRNWRHSATGEGTTTETLPVFAITDARTQCAHFVTGTEAITGSHSPHPSRWERTPMQCISQRSSENARYEALSAQHRLSPFCLAPASPTPAGRRVSRPTPFPAPHGQPDPTPQTPGSCPGRRRWAHCPHGHLHPLAPADTATGLALPPGGYLLALAVLAPTPGLPEMLCPTCRPHASGPIPDRAPVQPVAPDAALPAPIRPPTTPK